MLGLSQLYPLRARGPAFGLRDVGGLRLHPVRQPLPRRGCVLGHVADLFPPLKLCSTAMRLDELLAWHEHAARAEPRVEDAILIESRSTRRKLDAERLSDGPETL
jgi:hypothetical protein